MFKTRLVRNDDYEEMASSYQCLQVSELDAILKQHGVSDAKIRQSICEAFLFNIGILHDQCWFKASPSSHPVHPLLCFSTHFLNLGTPVDQLGDVFAPSPYFSFREYAFGSVSVFYEGGPDAYVEHGAVSDE